MTALTTAPPAAAPHVAAAELGRPPRCGRRLVTVVDRLPTEADIDATDASTALLDGRGRPGSSHRPIPHEPDERS